VEDIEMKKSILASACLVLAIPCQARIITVDANGTADFNNIQAAIDDANDNDIVIVADGIYTGQGNRDIEFKGKAITVRSENGPENCIIDCNGTESDRHRGFKFFSGEDGNSAIIGFTITNGYAPIQMMGGLPEIFASIGGAILCGWSSPTISNCTIRGNQAIGDDPRYDAGGGIHSWNASPTITNCTFTGNSGRNGGGIACYGWFQPSSPTLANCTFVKNSAYHGGGMYNVYSAPTLANCTFTDNVAQGAGGAIANYERNNVTLTNCTFGGNIATNGNAVSCDSQQQRYPSTVEVTNSILWDGGSEIWNNDNSVITVTYSDVQAGYSGEGNINVDPCFADPCNGDYHLSLSSPCIDAADNTAVPLDTADLDGDGKTNELVPWDLDGHPRFVDGDSNDSVIVDMGAYEFGYDVSLECMKQTAAEYTNWIYWGKPDCWCYGRQCRGDADGMVQGPFWVSLDDLIIFRTAVSKLEPQLRLVPNGICADFDHQQQGPFWASLNDLIIFRLYVSKTAAMVPPCDQPPPNTGPYNFWTWP
jgi:hypothetical protein